jgi:hypothetical protein
MKLSFVIWFLQPLWVVPTGLAQESCYDFGFRTGIGIAKRWTSNRPACKLGFELTATSVIQDDFEYVKAVCTGGFQDYDRGIQEGETHEIERYRYLFPCPQEVRSCFRIGYETGAARVRRWANDPIRRAGCNYTLTLGDKVDNLKAFLSKHTRCNVAEGDDRFAEFDQGVQSGETHEQRRYIALNPCPEGGRTASRRRVAKPVAEAAAETAVAPVKAAVETKVDAAL